MNRIIITAIGLDRPGLVNKITSIVNKNNGNIENSKMVKIEDQFAVIIDFTSPENLDKIKLELNSIEKLQVYYKLVKSIKADYKSISTYLIKGADDQGIVDIISNYFKDRNLNIVEINTFIEPAPITGSPLFNMKIKIECGSLSEDSQIRKELIQICNQLNLTLT